MKRVKILGILLPFFMLLAGDYKVHTFAGKVQRVIDGDTFVFISSLSHSKMRIRVYGIDAPESKQINSLGVKIGKLSTLYLKELIEGKNIRVKIIKTGYYGRPIAKVFYKNRDIGLQMIRQGHALTSFYPDYDSRTMKLKYESSMNIAMMRRIGIWREGSFYRPDYYRKLTRKNLL
jgi:endonuclease YncB( thermonuclease family)